MTPSPTIPDDLKVTIAKIIALQSLATDPGQHLLMTSAVIRWVRVGLVMKYGKVPAHYAEGFESSRKKYQEAVMKYVADPEYWGDALLRCSDIADNMASIAAAENMLDYRQLDFNFTTTTFGPPADQAPGGDA